MCQGYTIGISLMNVSTPRFLMAVYPELALVVVFLLWMGWRNVFDRPSAP
jgi:hypothetical protein